MTTYKIGDRIEYKNEPGTVVNIERARCKCKGKHLYHITLDNGDKITVSEKNEDTINPLGMAPNTNIPPLSFK